VKTKIVHVSHSSRFYENFIKFNKDFDEIYDNFYFVFGKCSSELFKTQTNVFQFSKNIKSYFFGYLKLIRFILCSDKIILHGLFDPRILIILNILPFLLKKSIWFLWGGDLYVYREREQHKLKEFFRRRVIKNLGAITTYVKGDYLLAKEWYGTKAEFIQSILYPSNIASIANSSNSESKGLGEGGVTVVVGNSADPQNKHLDILQELAHWKKRIAKVYLPLSYGSKQYAEEIIGRFSSEFDDGTVKPIEDYLPLEEYLAIISKADIAIYAHKRQQGMGNTLQMLSQGKTVYIRSDVSQWEYFNSIGVTVKDIHNVDIDDLLISSIESQENRKIIFRHHNKEIYRQQLKKIYSE